MEQHSESDIEMELNAVAYELHRGADRVVAFSGSPGCGKTTVAMKLARILASDVGGVVRYIRCGSAALTLGELEAFLVRRKFPEYDMSFVWPQVSDLAQTALADITVLVLDDVPDLELPLELSRLAPSLWVLATCGEGAVCPSQVLLLDLDSFRGTASAAVACASAACARLSAEEAELVAGAAGYSPLAATVCARTLHLYAGLSAQQLVATLADEPPNSPQQQQQPQQLQQQQQHSERYRLVERCFWHSFYFLGNGAQQFVRALSVFEAPADRQAIVAVTGTDHPDEVSLVA